MKHILYTMALAAVALAGCGGMDETYKALRGDGPILYLGKFPENSIQVFSGKKRLRMVLPAITDIRVAKGAMTWWSDGANRTKDFDVNPDSTEVLIDTLVDEGAYVFSLTLYDATGSYSSLATTINGVTYGDAYEGTLQESNRKLASAHRDGTKKMTITFLSTDVPPLAATRVSWKIKNTTWRDTLIYPYYLDGAIVSPDTLVIRDFSSDSIAYSAIFKPTDTFIDEFVVGPGYATEEGRKDEYDNPVSWTN